MAKIIRTTAQKKHTPRPTLRHTKEYKKVYWPYLPVILLLLSMGAWLSLSRLKPGQSPGSVLSYATDISESALLAKSNEKRVDHNISELALHPLLSKAAQAKANDMASKNYWSHISPDGISPWTFIDASDYSYRKAGENLAYGFSTSTATIVGWMNSPSHRSNLLDTDYTDVGFGIANIPNYQSEGEQTLIVAMYGAPSTSEEHTLGTINKLLQYNATDPVTSDSNIRSLEQTKPKSIARIQLLTGGAAPWSLLALLLTTGIVGTAWMARHIVRVKRALYDGEQFVISHPLVDTLVLLLIFALYILSRNVGTIL